MGLPLALFLIVPVTELWLLSVVESRIGLGTTLLLIVVTGVVGAALVRHQGFAVLAAVRDDVRMGLSPGPQLGHGALVLVGGALLLTPGFLTDAVGFALMVPAVREVIRQAGSRYLRARMVRR